MSIKNVEKFFDLIKSDENIAKELIKINNKLQQKDSVFDEEQFIKSKVVPIAKKHGINFTAKEFLEYAENQISELSDEELLNISGGASQQSVAWGFLLAILSSFFNVAAINSYPLVTPIVMESDQEEKNNYHKKSASNLQENNADSKEETSNKKHNKQKNIKKSTTNTNRLGKEKRKNTSKETDRVNTFALQNRGSANFVEDEIRNEKEDKTANATNESIGQNLAVQPPDQPVQPPDLDDQPTNPDREQQDQPEEQLNQDVQQQDQPEEQLNQDVQQQNQPEKQPDQPEKQPDQPEKQQDQPEEQPNQPEKQPDQPEKQPDQPEEQPNQPEEQPNQPEKQPDQPEKQPDQPEKQPDQPEKQQDQPEKQQDQPEEQPNQPKKQPDQPEEQLNQGDEVNSQDQAEQLTNQDEEQQIQPEEQPNQDDQPTNRDEQQQDLPEEQLNQGNDANSQDQDEDTKTQEQGGDLNPQSQDEQPQGLPDQPTNRDEQSTNPDEGPTNQGEQPTNPDEQIIDNYNNSSPRWRNILKYGTLAAGTLAAVGYYVYTGELPLFAQTGIALLSAALGGAGSQNNSDINKSSQNINFANTTNAHSALSPIYSNQPNQFSKDALPPIQKLGYDSFDGNTTITPSWRVADENLPSYNGGTLLPQDLIFSPGEWHNPSQDDLGSSKLENLNSAVIEGGAPWSGEHFIRRVPVDGNEIQLQENASQIQTPVVGADSAATQFVGQQGSNIPTSVDVNKTPLNYESSGSYALVDKGQTVINNPLRSNLSDTVDQRTVGILKKVEDRNSEKPSIKPTSYAISNSSGVNIPGDDVITTSPKGSNIPRGKRPVINIESSIVPDAAAMQLQNGTNIKITPNTYNPHANVSGTMKAGAPQTNTSNTSSTEVNFPNSGTSSADVSKDNADITTFSPVEDKSTNKEASSWSPLAIAGTIAGAVASLAAGFYNWLRPADQQYSGCSTAFDKGYNIFVGISEKINIDKAPKKMQQKLKENLIRSFLKAKDENINAKDLQTVIISSDGSTQNRNAAIKNAAENSKLINRATTCVDVPIIVSQKNPDDTIKSATMNVYVDNYVCTMSWDANQPDNVTFSKPDDCPDISTQNFEAAKQLLLKHTKKTNAQTASPQEKLNQLIANLRSHTVGNLPLEVQSELKTFFLLAKIDYDADQMVFTFGKSARLDGTTINKNCTKTNKALTDAQVFQKFVKAKCPFEFQSRPQSNIEDGESFDEYNEVMNEAAILSVLLGGRPENTDLVNRIKVIKQSDEFNRYGSWLQKEIDDFLSKAQAIIFVTQAPAEQPAENTQTPVELQDKNNHQNENAKEQTVNTGQLPVTQENPQSAQTPNNNDQQLTDLEKKIRQDTRKAQKRADRQKRRKQKEEERGNGLGRNKQRYNPDRLTSSDEEPQSTSITSDENQVENSQIQVTPEPPAVQQDQAEQQPGNNAQTTQTPAEAQNLSQENHQQPEAPAAEDDNQLFKKSQIQRSKSLNKLNTTQNEKTFSEPDMPDMGSGQFIRLESETYSDANKSVFSDDQGWPSGSDLIQQNSQNSTSGQYFDENNATNLPPNFKNWLNAFPKKSALVNGQNEDYEYCSDDYGYSPDDEKNKLYENNDDDNFGNQEAHHPTESTANLPTGFKNLINNVSSQPKYRYNYQSQVENQQHVQTTTPNRQQTNVQHVTPLLERTNNAPQQNAQIPQPENEPPPDQTNHLTNLHDNQQTPPPAPNTTLQQIQIPPNTNLNQIPDPIKMATVITPTKNNPGLWGSIKNFFSPGKNNNETPNQGTPQNGQTPAQVTTQNNQAPNQGTQQNNNNLHLSPWDNPDGDDETNEEFGSPTTPKEENPARKKSKSNSPYKKNGDTYSGFSAFD